MLFISDCESFGDACVFITKQLHVHLYMPIFVSSIFKIEQGIPVI